MVDARGKYALPHADEAIRAAHRLTGVVSHRSAAAHWGWPQKSLPSKPELTVPRNRVVSPETRRAVLLHRTDLAPDEVDGFATTRARTLVDVLRSCPFDEALAIADSALRSESLTPAGLARVAASARGPGSARVRCVAAAASGLAANPFESVLRAHAPRGRTGAEAPGPALRLGVPRAAGSGRCREPGDRRSRLVRVARKQICAAPRRPTLQRVRPPRLGGAALLVGRRHASSGLRPGNPGASGRSGDRTRPLRQLSGLEIHRPRAFGPTAGP